MILTAVMEHLQEVPDTFAAVKGAEGLEAISKGVAPQHGTLFVVPYEERPGPNAVIGAFRQPVEVLFLVVVVIRQHGDVHGAGRLTASDHFSAAIETALAGWSWNGEAEPAELALSRAAPAGNGVTLFVQTWRTTRWIGT